MAWGHHQILEHGMGPLPNVGAWHGATTKRIDEDSLSNMRR